MSEKKFHVLRVPMAVWDKIVKNPSRQSYKTIPSFAVELLDSVASDMNVTPQSHNLPPKSAPSAAPGRSQPHLEEKTQKTRLKKIYDIVSRVFILESVNSALYNKVKEDFCVFIENLKNEVAYGPEYEKLKEAYKWLHLDANASIDTPDVKQGIIWAERIMK